MTASAFDLSLPAPELPALQSIALSIAELRGQRVILDSDLAALYGVEIKRFNEQVKRNLQRFPADFMFQLQAQEYAALRSQIATLKTGRGQHRKYLPYAFTEHGSLMAATILNSPRAVQVSVYVVRAFVRLRQASQQSDEFSQRLAKLEEQTEKLELNYEGFSHNTRLQLRQVFDALKQLTQTPVPLEAPKRPIGFIHPKTSAPRSSAKTSKKIQSKRGD